MNCEFCRGKIINRRESALYCSDICSKRAKSKRMAPYQAKYYRETIKPAIVRWRSSHRRKST